MELREWRYKNRLSQKDLAKLLQCSKSAISKWENGSRKPGGMYMYYIKQITNGEVTEKDFEKK